MPSPIQGPQFQAQPWRTLPVTYPATALPSTDGPAGAGLFGTVTDNFNRADSTTTINPASDGGLWTVDLGTWGIDANRGYVAAAGAVVENWIRRDVGSNIIDMSVDIFVPSTNDQLCYLDIAGTTGLSRTSGSWDGYEVAFDGTAATVQILRISAAVVTAVGSAVVADWRGTTVTWRLVHDGAGNLSLYQNGTAIISGAHDSSGPPATGTAVVLGLDTTSASHGGGPGLQRIDNFTATGTPTGRGWVVGAISLN